MDLFVKFISEEPLLYHPRDLNLTPSKPIAEKLKKEFERAQQHLQAQKAPRTPEELQELGKRVSKYEVHCQSFKSVDIAHAQGSRREMEDAYVAASGEIRVEGEKPLPYELFGIIDGHGGDATSRFVAAHIQKEIEAAIVQYGTSEEGIWTALKEAFVQLDAKVVHEVGLQSGAVAVISIKIGNDLWTANLGDSRAILKVGNEVIQLSVDAKPDDARFQKSIEKRGGSVEVNPWAGNIPRINGILACARAFGDKSLQGENAEGEPHYIVSPRPKITKVDLNAYEEKPIYLIQACDGVWDVFSSLDVGSMELNAETIVKRALNAGSTDNCSALVAILSSPKSFSPSL